MDPRQRSRSQDQAAETTLALVAGIVVLLGVLLVAWLIVRVTGVQGDWGTPALYAGAIVGVAATIGILIRRQDI